MGFGGGVPVAGGDAERDACLRRRQSSFGARGATSGRPPRPDAFTPSRPVLAIQTRGLAKTYPGRPPVVARVLDFGVAGDPCVRSPCTSACRESAHAFPALMNAVAGRPDLWCALKIARDSGNEETTEHLIAEVERCGGLCGCPTANESTPRAIRRPLS